MAEWVDQYAAALDLRDAREKAHQQFIDAYTRLADRTAGARAAGLASSASPSGGQDPALEPRGVSRSEKGPKSLGPDAGRSSYPSAALTTLRADLSATQKARGALQEEVGTLTASLAALQTTVDRSASQIASLTKQRVDLERRLRDRDEELRGKARLVEQAQDEMVSLSLQMNMAEQRSERLEKENKELVDRWMKRMGEEADRVNEGSGWR